jgi:trigger factor
MQVTETLNEGLKREIKVVVPAEDMEARLLKRLEEARPRVRINGFRPGKVPLPYLRRLYGKSFMAEIVNEILSSTTRDILAKRGEKAAMQPEIEMTEDEKQAEKILAAEADFEFSLTYEVVPDIEVKDVSDISVERLVYDVTAEEIEEQVMRVAESARPYEAKDTPAEKGDRVTIDFVGKIDGKAFEGGSAEGETLVLGSDRFLPGFEEQLVGARAGENRTLTVTFPEDYPAEHLAGKQATFDVHVREVAKPGDLKIDDELAKNLGVESAEQLRDIIRKQIESQYGALTRQKVKRQILDALDERYKFDVPSKLVEAEFENIWKQVERDLTQAGRTFEDEDTTEEAARAEYRQLAERRVRLGLVLAAIGEKENVQVSDEEMQRALVEYVRRAPAHQQQEIFEFYRNNPSALANLRAPLFEEKVIDHLMTRISVTDRKVSREELLADDDEDEAVKAKTDAAASESNAGSGAKKKTPPRKKAASKEKDTSE